MEEELNLLISKNLEGYQEYSGASQEVKNKNFKSFLLSYAETRKKFADELRQILLSKGLEVKGKPSVLNDVHRGFMKIRMMLSDFKDKALLKECERMEARTLSAYEKLMDKNELPNEVMSTVLRQRSKILATKRTLRDIAPILRNENVKDKLDQSKSES